MTPVQALIGAHTG